MSEQALMHQVIEETVSNFSLEKRVRELHFIAVKRHLLPDEHYEKVFLKSLKNRTLSSIAEMILSKFPLVTDLEEKETDEFALALIKKLGYEHFTVDAFAALLQVNFELAIKARMLGHMQLENILFLQTVKNLEEIIVKIDMPIIHSGYLNEDVAEENLIPFCYDEYPDPTEYASCLFHILRHATTLNGSENTDELAELLCKVFDGKSLLEIGCGPGYLLHIAQEFGANVMGVDSYREAKNWANIMGVPILVGTVDNLQTNNTFDYIVSKNFFSSSVKSSGTKDFGKLALHTNESAIHVHQVKMETYDETVFLETLENMYNDELLDEKLERFHAQKSMYIQKYMPNISEMYFELMGYEQLTDPRVDPLDFLTYVLRR